jgi:hypothetical protein
VHLLASNATVLPIAGCDASITRFLSLEAPRPDPATPAGTPPGTPAGTALPAAPVHLTWLERAATGAKGTIAPHGQARFGLAFVPPAAAPDAQGRPQRAFFRLMGASAFQYQIPRGDYLAEVELRASAPDVPPARALVHLRFDGDTLHAWPASADDVAAFEQSLATP